MSDESEELNLRKGLPEALRVLLKEFPREAWESNPNFGGLVQFWLDRHMTFRRLNDLLTQDVEAFLDRKLDPRTYGPRLGRFGSMLVNELHGHHHIEDAHYFPVLSRAEPRLSRGFEILDHDHHDLEAHLASFAERANAVLGQMTEPGAIDAAGAFHDGLKQFERFLDRHLTDEEELVVPVILKHAPEGLM